MIFLRLPKIIESYLNDAPQPIFFELNLISFENIIWKTIFGTFPDFRPNSALSAHIDKSATDCRINTNKLLIEYYRFLLL